MGEGLQILNQIFQRAVRPDKFGSRAAQSDRPRLGHSSPLLVFNFLNFILNFLKEFKFIRHLIIQPIH